mmetsp:Transcript_43441/g.116243  ORF Transcript_43441/g.116243 Transcript_43441/m.116243 type:complete len:210 (-) Transcript_43441:207-836(-)
MPSAPAGDLLHPTGHVHGLVHGVRLGHLHLRGGVLVASDVPSAGHGHDARARLRAARGLLRRRPAGRPYVRFGPAACPAQVPAGRGARGVRRGSRVLPRSGCPVQRERDGACHCQRPARGADRRCRLRSQLLAARTDSARLPRARLGQRLIARPPAPILHGHGRRLLPHLVGLRPPHRHRALGHPLPSRRLCLPIRSHSLAATQVRARA